MPRRYVPLVPENFYHVYNRGHNYSKIFLEPENYVFFLQRLRKYVATQHADILAYVLMPNHYHLLVKLRSKNFSHAMQNFAISYSKAMNERYQRVGSLFQGAFQSRLVDKDEYLLHLSRYIHLNPVQAGLVKQAQDWNTPVTRSIWLTSGYFTETRGYSCSILPPDFRSLRDFGNLCGIRLLSRICRG